MRHLLALVVILLLNSCTSKIKAPVSLDLNGDWQFRKVGQNEWTKATVPGVVQLDMLNVGLIDDPFYAKNEEKIGWIELENWEYERTFDVSAELLLQDVVEIVFEGLDTYAEVKINGTTVLNANNMFRTWRINCKEQLVEGVNKISVLLRSPIKEKEKAYESLPYRLPAGNDAGQIKVSPFVRKAPYHFGWDWGPRIVTMGIWRPVRLEAYTVARITDLYFEQKEVNKRVAKITTHVSLDVSEVDDLSIIIKEGERVIAKEPIDVLAGAYSHELSFEIPNPKLWWSNGLGEPYLYKWTVELRKGDFLLSSHEKEIGLRTIELVQEKDSIGTSYYFKLNGVPVFMKGANYIPQDNLLPRVTQEDYSRIIENAVLANMNMLRVWGGGIYEEDYFYELCDKNGILVWQDFMFACGMYPSDQDFIENVKKEVQQNVQRLRNHACLALWCGNNEMGVAWENWGWQKQFAYSSADSTEIINGYKKVFHELIPNELKALKVQQDYVSTSPLSNWGTPENFNHHSMHYWGVWHGRESFENYRTNVGRFMSEYGFQSFPEMKTIKAFADSSQWDLDSEVMQHHQKSYIGNGMIQKHLEQYYPKPNNFADFVYLSQLTQVTGIEMAIKSHRKSRHCMGTLYWQLNDCWVGPSWSSIDYFGRWKALHYKVKNLYKDILLIGNIDAENQLDLRIASDKRNAIEGTVFVEIKNLNGVELALFQKEKVRIEGNTVDQISFDLKESLRSYNKEDIVLRFSFLGTEDYYQSFYYLVPPKNLNLEKVTIQKTLEKVTEGYRLTLKSNTLAKDVWVDIPNKEVQYSDNYFDVQYGEKEEKHILLKTKEVLTVDEIVIKTLNDLM